MQSLKVEDGTKFYFSWNKAETWHEWKVLTWQTHLSVPQIFKNAKAPRSPRLPRFAKSHPPQKQEKGKFRDVNKIDAWNPKRFSELNKIKTWSRISYFLSWFPSTFKLNVIDLCLIFTRDFFYPLHFLIPRSDINTEINERSKLING